MTLKEHKWNMKSISSPKKQHDLLILIPARGGSKRLPGKNIKLLHNKPLISWTIEAGLKAGLSNYVVVSTDDVKIADIAKDSGALVPFIRPNELSGDTAKSIDVVLHAIDFFEKQDIYFQHLMLLQPTSPARDALHIQAAYDLFKNKGADGIVSVCPVDHSPLWSNTLPEDHSMKDFMPQNLSQLRSQDLPQYYRINGALYIYKIDKLKNQKSFFYDESVFAYPMPTECSIDIDHEIDFEIAKAILNQKTMIKKTA